MAGIYDFLPQQGWQYGSGQGIQAAMGQPAGPNMASGYDIMGDMGNNFGGYTDVPVDAGGGGGIMGVLRGQPGVAGDGLTGWLGKGNNAGILMQGISALGNAWLGFQQLNLAKKNLALQKEAYKTNMANTVQSYNTSLEDRIRGRTAEYAGKEADVQSYLNQNSLSATPTKQQKKKLT